MIISQAMLMLNSRLIVGGIGLLFEHRSDN